MDLVNPLAEAYAEKFSSPQSELLAAIARYTYAHHPHAHMLSGPVQGKFLEIISLLLQPRRILEIGTFTGFSGLCLARGLAPDGQLHTIELRQQEANTARAYFDQSDKKDQLILHLGNALEIIPRLEEVWDLVFIDADKPGYLDYYELVLPRVRPGGLILADNVFFHGEVLQDTPKGKNALAIQAFNEYVRQDNRVEEILLTLRDGVMVIIKK